MTLPKLILFAENHSGIDAQATGQKRSPLSFALATALALIILTTIGSSPARGSHSDEPKEEPVVLAPAKRYNGSAPIDMKNGKLFNNGTFGKRNPEYESFSEKLTMPGLSEKPYPYRLKDSFVNALNEQVKFTETAINNWQKRSEITKPEVIEYSKDAIAKFEPLLAKLKQTTKRAAASAQGEWEQAQNEARRVLGEVRSTYQQLHKNVDIH